MHFELHHSDYLNKKASLFVLQRLIHIKGRSTCVLVCWLRNPSVRQSYRRAIVSFPVCCDRDLGFNWQDCLWIRRRFMFPVRPLPVCGNSRAGRLSLSLCLTLFLLVTLSSLSAVYSSQFLVHFGGRCEVTDGLRCFVPLFIYFPGLWYTSKL